VNIELADLLTPLAFVVGGLILGFVFEKIVLGSLRERPSGTRLNWGGAVAEAFRSVVTLWIGIAGVYLALARFSLGSAVEGFLRDALLAALILTIAFVAARFAGRLADAIVAMPDDPAEDASVTARVDFVMRGGRVWRRPESAAV